MINFLQAWEGAAIAQWWQQTGLQVNKLSDRSCTSGMIHTKIEYMIVIEYIIQGCPRPSIVLQYRIVA